MSRKSKLAIRFVVMAIPGLIFVLVGWFAEAFEFTREKLQNVLEYLSDVLPDPNKE